MQKKGMKSRVLSMMLVFLLVLSPITVLAEKEEQEVNYVSIGDSLAAGVLFNGNVGTGYTGGISSALDARGYAVNVTNKGIPGATSADILASLDNIPELAEADIVTISAGANDLLSGLDMSMADRFDPTYLNPGAVEKSRNTAKTVAIESVTTAVGTANESLTEAVSNIEATTSAVDELITKTAPYEALLPTDVKSALTTITSHLQRAQEKIGVVKESGYVNLDVEAVAYAATLQVKQAQLAEAAHDLNIVSKNIAVIEAQLANYTTMLPQLANIQAEVDKAKAQIGLAQNHVAHANEAFATALTALNLYAETLEEIANSVASAIEIQQLLASLPGKVTTIGQNVAQIVAAVKQVNPNADVYLLGYYNALPYLSASLQELTVPLITNLNQVNQAAATETGANFVPTFDLFTGIYETYLPNPADVHPSEAGYQAISEAFMNQMSESFPVITDLDEEVPREELPPVNEEETVTPVDSDEESDDPEEEQEDETVIVGAPEDETTKNQETGSQLPQTATNQYEQLLAGLVFLLLGSGIWLFQRRQRKIEA